MELNKRRIVLRADGNSEIGLGHVYRSLALAEMLKNKFQLTFVIRNPISELKNIISKTCDEYIALPALEKSKELDMIANLLKKEDVVVLDGYHFDGEYQKTVRKLCHKIISINDMHKDHFYSDVILNHCGKLDPNIYDKEPYTKLLLGERYALLRPEFLEAARQKDERNIANPKTLFVCMGGSDIHNLTFKVLQAVQEFDQLETINCVLGAANKHNKSIKSIMDKDKRFQIYSNLGGSAMCALMKKSDIAIAPGSSISFEICAVGMGFLSGYYTDNQHDVVNWLDKSGCATIIGDFRRLSVEQIRCRVDNFLNNESISALINNQKVIDGYSDERLKTFFCAL